MLRALQAEARQVLRQRQEVQAMREPHSLKFRVRWAVSLREVSRLQTLVRRSQERGRPERLWSQQMEQLQALQPFPP